jgi:Type II secretion system (T2SS), protein E, N-terminal domain
MTAARLDHTFFDREVRPQLGSILLDKGFVTSDQLDRALAERARGEELLGETLVRLGYVFEEDLARVLAEQAGVPYLNLQAVDVDRYAAAMVPRQLGETLLALPVRFTPEGGLVIAVADERLMRQLAAEIKCPIVLNVAAASCIRAGWRRTPQV